MDEKNLKKYNILVVEDENIVAMDIARSLKRLGYNVPLIVNTGEDAIAGVEQFLPDLVLMDIQLKGEMSGIQAAQEIRNTFNIPIVFLTAYADEATLQKAKEAEPYGYLLKPFEEIELHTAVEVILKKHNSMMIRENISSKKLEDIEERFSLFIESVKDYAIYMLDTNGFITSWNNGASRIEGYSAAEAIGKHVSIFYASEVNAEERISQIFTNAQTFGRFTEEGWRQRRDGTEFWAHLTITAIYNKNNELCGYGKVIHDLTKKKNEEVVLKNAIATRDEFLSIASHELKTPLSILDLQSKIMKGKLLKKEDNFTTHERFVAFVEITMKHVARLNSLVEDMLDVSRIKNGKFFLNKEFFDLKELVQENINTYHERFIQAKCGAPEFICPLNNVNGYWDRGKVEQVIRNLFNNALLYAKGAPIKITLTATKEFAQFKIEDNGIGIAPENLKKIFNRFERAVDLNEVSGLGLGLYISSQIIEAHNGKIWGESVLGKGSTFFLNLPMKPVDSSL